MTSTDRPLRRRRLTLSLTSTLTVALVAAEVFLGPAVSAQSADATASSAATSSSTATVPITITADAPLDPAVVAAATGGTGRIAGTIEAIGATVIEVPAARAFETARRLDAAPGVDTVQRDQDVRAFFTPNDPLFATYQASLVSIGAPVAWDVSTGSPSVVIAVVDSGVDPVGDLAGRLLPGYDFVNGDTDASDDYFHGTASALVAAAAGNNNSGAAGMCWTCQVLPVKVLDDEGVGSMFDVAAGIVWAADHGADVINLSLGGLSSDRAVTDALAYAFARDIVVVASAGNDGVTARNYPAAAPGVISVGGVTGGRTIHPQSNRGPTWVDVAAPFCNTIAFASSPSDFCGTSSSAPIVAGTAGLLRSVRPAADRQMVETAIVTTSEFAPTAGQVGYGVIDAGRAAAAIPTVAAGPTPPPPDVTPPTSATIAIPGGYVRDWTTVWLDAVDDQPLWLDELTVDGQTVATVADAGYAAALTFDTRSFGDGEHTVVGYTTDRGGNRIATAAGTIRIDNVNPLGLLVSPTSGAKVTGSFVARAYVTDPSGIMGTFLVANDQIVGGSVGAGFIQATVPVTRSGPIRVVAITVDNAGRISGTNTAIVMGTAARRKARR